MKFISTRGQASPASFVDACLSGLAPDGGLFVPETWPRIEPAEPNENYVDVAVRVLAAFAEDELDEATLRGICERAYASFAHQSVAPLVQWGPNAFLMELHHGPTLAFKDVAMQLIAQFFDTVLSRRGERMSVTCATSGDTGGAAAAAFAGASNVDLFILHPFERISPVQRRFMTTTGASNVHNIAIDEDFDACQAIVKALFADRDFVVRSGLSGVNSINWARIAAQAVYYATAQAALGTDRPLRFVVPSGNMGDALAGYVAARCGLLHGFEAVCAVNENDALRVLLGEGRMARASAVSTVTTTATITTAATTGVNGANADSPSSPASTTTAALRPAVSVGRSASAHTPRTNSATGTVSVAPAAAADSPVAVVSTSTATSMPAENAPAAAKTR